MGFKDDVATDIEETFLNENELADLHTIDGVEMLASIDDYELIKREKNVADSHEEGTHMKRVLLFTSMKSLKKLPASRNILTLDGKKYIVIDAREDNGVAEITLEVRRS